MTKIRLIAIIVGFSVLIIIIPLIIGFGKTGESTSVLGKDYSYLNRPAIISRLNSDFPLPQTLILRHQDSKFTIDTASISAQINTSQTANNLLFRRLNLGLINYLRSFFTPKFFTLEIDYDQSLLDVELQKISNSIDRPFIPSELALESKRIVLKSGQVGRRVDLSKFEQLIVNRLTSYHFQDSSIVPIDTIGNLPDSPQVDQAITRATKLIGKSLALNYDTHTIVLDDKVLISWVGFATPCQAGKINDYVNTISTSIKKDPVDAVFKFENNQVLDFQSAQNGYTIIVDQTNLDLCQSLGKLIDSPDKTLSITLPLSFTPPKITNSDVNSLGIKELLGRGTSSFSHSTAIRNFNVEKGASIVNRLLVAPGDEFSFLKALGDVTLEAGYKKAYVIKKGKTELDVGGGICQVSTTFFRAILNAGLDITQRKAHAYRVQYYEEDTKPGFDATVFIPSPDLRFINDTGHYLLIQSQYDGKNKKLAYEIYGTSDGRTVEVSNYRQWDYAPPPPDIYIDDPTLPPGKVVKDESRIPGLKTSFDWKVSRNGETIHQKSFVSNYVPWAAVYRRGPSL